MTDDDSTASTDPYVQVGRSGLTLYRVGLGTMQFGWSVDEAGSFKVMDAYAEIGGTFIDTAAQEHDQTPAQAP